MQRHRDRNARSVRTRLGWEIPKVGKGSQGQNVRVLYPSQRSSDFIQPTPATIQPPQLARTGTGRVLPPGS